MIITMTHRHWMTAMSTEALRSRLTERSHPSVRSTVCRCASCGTVLNAFRNLEHQHLANPTPVVCEAAVNRLNTRHSHVSHISVFFFERMKVYLEFDPFAASRANTRGHLGALVIKATNWAISVGIGWSAAFGCTTTLLLLSTARTCFRVA